LIVSDALTGDLQLKWDPELKAITQEFAADNDVFLEEFQVRYILCVFIFILFFLTACCFLLLFLTHSFVYTASFKSAWKKYNNLDRFWLPHPPASACIMIQ
jgi:hypothetical protein